MKKCAFRGMVGKGRMRTEEKDRDCACFSRLRVEIRNTVPFQ